MSTPYVNDRLSPVPVQGQKTRSHETLATRADLASSSQPKVRFLIVSSSRLFSNLHPVDQRLVPKLLGSLLPTLSDLPTISDDWSRDFIWAAAESVRRIVSKN
jgi:hypothetical protein